MDNISVEIGKQRFTGPDAVGEALRARVLAVKEEATRGRLHVDRVVGRFGGFDLSIVCINGEHTPVYHLTGNAVYEAAPYQMGPALVAGLLATLDTVKESADKAGTLLQTRRKRLVDLQVELGRPFEHALRLQTLQARQAELIEQLDLTKDEAGSQAADADTGAALVAA